MGHDDLLSRFDITFAPDPSRKESLVKASATILTLVAAMACGGGGQTSHTVLVAPRLNLLPYGSVGLVTFSIEKAKGTLNEFATRRFEEYLLAAQSGIEVQEFSQADSTAALSGARGVPVVFLGRLKLSDVKPREVRREQRGQPSTRRLGVTQPAARGERLVPEPARRRVRLREAPRHALQHCLVIQAVEAPDEARRAHDALEPRPVLGDGVAQPIQDRARWHPDAGADERPAGRDVKIEPRPTAFRITPHAGVRVPMIEPARGVRLVG